MDVILKLISFHINTIQHDLILTTNVIITSTSIPERRLCIFIDRIFLYSLIYKCEMKISLYSGQCQIKQTEILIIK